MKVEASIISTLNRCDEQYFQTEYFKYLAEINSIDFGYKNV